jgi:hypothetical protein
MDLSAYVARFVMGEMDEKEASEIKEDFKFTYYVTYFNEEQSCGLRMLRLLKELNSKHFDLVVRLSSQRSARWDQNYLNSVLPPTCEKLWICGTPVMNDVFEAAFHNLSPKFPYLKDLEVVQATTAKVKVSTVDPLLHNWHHRHPSELSAWIVRILLVTTHN